MIVNYIINIFENYAPSQLQESYDNSGLITGNKDLEISNILITLDCTEDVVEEAIVNKCNMIIAHHPIIFSGLKKINGKNYVERVIIKAISFSNKCLNILNSTCRIRVLNQRSKNSSLKIKSRHITDQSFSA